MSLPTRLFGDFERDGLGGLTQGQLPGVGADLGGLEDWAAVCARLGLHPINKRKYFLIWSRDQDSDPCAFCDCCGADLEGAAELQA